MEGILEKSARKEYDDWFARCLLELEKMRKTSAFDGSSNNNSKSDDVRLAMEPSFVVFNRHQIRQKTSSLSHAAVRGAERFMSALIEHSPESDEADRPLIHIDVDGRRNMVKS